jgi:hypothetical protein
LFLLFILGRKEIIGSPGKAFSSDLSSERGDEEELSETSAQFLQYEVKKASSSSGDPSSQVTPLGERVSNLEDHFPEESS